MIGSPPGWPRGQREVLAKLPRYDYHCSVDFENPVIGERRKYIDSGTVNREARV
ncbi:MULTISPECIES: hypothetical protein [Thermoprotei]|uniref:hypothetical protein n=1 Tax=Thermoprotei TaxID=183924 RepID=UPI00316825AA